MLFKDKLKLIMLSIITLGVYPILVLRSKNTKTSLELSTTEKLIVNIDKLRKELGGKENITGATNTHNKVKVDIKTRNGVTLDNIKNLKGVSGVFATSTSVTIVVGNSAKKIASII